MTTTAATDAIVEVQAQISRADTKASILTGLALAALTGGTALATKTHPHGAALVAAVLTAALIGAALVLLGLAIRPDLRGNHGFVRWAATTSDTDLYSELAHDYPSDQQAEQLSTLALLSRSAYRKYTRIRRAVDLLGAALAAAAVTVLLSGLGW
jgi:Family of unknown function (DUF5706)